MNCTKIEMHYNDVRVNDDSIRIDWLLEIKPQCLHHHQSMKFGMATSLSALLKALYFQFRKSFGRSMYHFGLKLTTLISHVICIVNLFLMFHISFLINIKYLST